MTANNLTSIRELDGRLTDGVQVRLLWNVDDGRLWVSVMNTHDGSSFCLRVRASERPLDVFHHPFAYAAQHGVETAGAGPRFAGDWASA